MRGFSSKNKGEVAASPRLVTLGVKCHTIHMYYVYILKSKKTGRLYRGSTKDIKQRFSEHNSGKTASTKSGIPWKLIYYEAFEHKKDALREEKFLKSGKGFERIKFLFSEK